MKNKKWRLALFGLITLNIILLNILIMMWYELIKNRQLLSGWAGLITSILLSLVGILSAFGAFNAIDKKTMSANEEIENDK